MTDLNEKWKKGKLPDGWYWCECYNEETKLLYYDGDSFELNDPETKNYYFFLPKDIEEINILDEVPIFEEWQASENYIDYLKQCISVYESKDKQATETSIAYNDLLEENHRLKELLKECELWFTGIVGNMNDKNVGEHNRNLPIGNFEHAFKVYSQKINQVLGEDK